VTLSDYSNAEKIFYPSPALTTSKVARGCTPAPGDITIYVPWGNVAIFYKNGSRSNDLIRIGRIDGNGIEALSIPGSLSVRFERQRQETPENNSAQNPT
jgi:flavodoxin